MSRPDPAVTVAAHERSRPRPPIIDDGSWRTSTLHLGGRRLPLVPPARMYVCGITPYDVTHLGHAATLVWADAAASVMRLAGAAVVDARNVTDVDDVLTRAAAEHGQRYDRFAAVQEYQFTHDLSALRVRDPQHAPRAGRHVDHVIALASALLAADDAYELDGSVVFRGSHVPAAAGVDDDEARRLLAETGGQPELDRYEAPFDVPVWQRSGPDDPAWPSPWGWGRPGWHAECTAMTMATLGARIDVLAGGADLAFPHHAYQTAMAEAVSGVPLTRTHLHVGTVSIDGAKMAKSTHNLVLVADLLRQHRPAALRLLLLDRVWHQPWEFSASDLEAASARVDALHAAAGRADGSTTASAAVGAALFDDLDVPSALSLAEQEGGSAARHLLRVLALH
ncbi:MAG: cysteine--tRNA ligase [Actinomycetota bacterium]|nr:cysteine--tRNA ligase [Actinomycetota bacterium]